MSTKSYKVTVSFERRADGGLRAWSDDVPGLVLSSSDVDGVLADVQSALTVILSERLCAEIEVMLLDDVREALEDGGVIDPAPSIVPEFREFAAYCR